MFDLKLADTVRLNVGGTSFMTTRPTLCKYPTSMLAALFRGDHIPAAVDETGAYFIDRDGSLFGYILNFLRSAQLKVPEGFAHLEQLAMEADFFQIEPLTDAVNSLLQRKQIACRQHVQVGRTLEIIEICKGRGIDGMVSNTHLSPMHQSVKTRTFGRRSDIMSLPPEFDAKPVNGYQGTRNHADQEAFTEMELGGGSNVRLRLEEYLRGGGWQLVRSDHSTCCGCCEMGYITILERSFRDSWFLPDH